MYMEKNQQETVQLLIKELKKHFPKPVIELQNWNGPFQLMVCVILSAQATDISVNKVTKNLFKTYKTPKDFSHAKPKNIETYILSINYYKTKAKRLILASQFIDQKLKGQLPENIDNWVKVPGIGRKSANVILISGQNLPAQGIVVDTHVTRVSRRLNLSKAKNAIQTEKELKKIIPNDKWAYISLAMVLFGRYICKSKKPQCDKCGLKNICTYYKTTR